MDFTSLICQEIGGKWLNVGFGAISKCLISAYGKEISDSFISWVRP